MYCNQADSAILKLSFVQALMEQIYCIKKQSYVTMTLFCRGMGYVSFTRVMSWIAFCSQYALFGFVFCRLLRRHLGFDSDFAQISGPKIGGWQLWSWLVSWGIRSISGSSKWGENRGWHRCVTFDEFVQFRRCHLINETTRVPGLYCSPLNPELYYPSSSLSISSPSPSSSSIYRNYQGKVWGLSPLWSDPQWTTLNVQCSYFLF